jgi:photosystem II stability/assembly factor-like uncharacterized protein
MPSVTGLAEKSISGPDGNFSSGPVSVLLMHFLPPFFAQAALLVAILFSCLLAHPAEAQNWDRLGPPGGNVISLAASSDGTVYLGTPDGHIFASTDRGEHWQLRGRAGTRLDGVVQRILPDKDNPARLLAAVWYQDPAQGGGIFQSLDGARHWSLAGLSGEAVRALEDSESDPRVWVAGTRRGVFRSRDGARTWESITPAGNAELQSIDSLAIDPSNPQIIYAGTYHLPWKTLDGGRTWFSIASGMIDDSDIMSLSIDASEPHRIFSSACSGVYRSDDAGASWTKLQGIPYASRRTQQIVQDSADPHSLYAATTEGLWQSADSGESWNRVTPREIVANVVLVLPGPAKNRLLLATESQGVLRSDDKASSFAPSNQGFSHHVIASLAADPHDSSHLLVRIEESSATLMETRDDGASWSELPGPVPSKTPLQIFTSSFGWWVTSAEGGLARRDFAGGSWTAVNFRETIRGALVGRKSAARRSPGRSAPQSKIVFPRVTSILEGPEKILVASDDGLWISDRDHPAFTRMSAKALALPIKYLSLDSHNSLYAIAGDLLWTGSFDASNWKQLSAPQNAGQVLWIVEIASAEVPVRLVGTQRGVFLGGPDAPWQLLLNGLPAIASLPIYVSGNHWLIAMSNGGSYQSADFGKTWQRMDTDSEQGRITSVIPTKENSFFVASQSEGILRLSHSQK